MTGPFVLLVEDNQDDEVLTCRALQGVSQRRQVVVLRDGAEALDFLFARGRYHERRADQLPTVVLLDLNLPKLSGHEVLREIRACEHTRYLPVVILTSSGEKDDVIQGYRAGANSYVIKPVGFDGFMAAVGRLGSYWLELNEGSDGVGAGAPMLV